jgi:predicted nucleic acid-binding protein
MYLFDTDVLSNIVRKSPSPLLLEKLKRIPGEFQFTTSINIGEIYYGAKRMAHSAKILGVFEEKVFPNISVLPFDENTAKIYGTLKANLEKKGSSKSEPDLRIASIALQHRLTLVTANIKHFQNIPSLNVESWL